MYFTTFAVPREEPQTCVCLVVICSSLDPTPGVASWKRNSRVFSLYNSVSYRSQQHERLWCRGYGSAIGGSTLFQQHENVATKIVWETLSTAAAIAAFH
jgi:hypothetical protein